MLDAHAHPTVALVEPSPFALAVRSRSWDWLLELRRHLKVDLLLVDGRLVDLLPRGAGEEPGHLALTLEGGNPSLRDLIMATLKTRSPQTARIDGRSTASTPVTKDGNPLAVLVVGRAVRPQPGAAEAMTHLELLASWLATAVEAHVSSPPSAPASGVDRIAPLATVLSAAAGRESDRELIRLFGEAVAVWHDIEVCGYVELPNGTFGRDVLLPGTSKGERPGVIPAVGLPDSMELVRLPEGHLDRFGLPVNSDVFVRRFSEPDGRSWLLLFTGVIGAYDLQRLGAYAALLELAFALSTARMTAAVSAAIGDALSEVTEAPERRARQALEEVRTRVGAAVAALTIERSGQPLIRVAVPDGAPSAPLDETAFRVVLVKRSERHYTTTVSLGRHERLQFTPRDHIVVGAAAKAFDLWAPTAFASIGRDERRAAPRAFPDILEGSAREAIARGFPVALVVLRVRGARASSAALHQWIAGIRGQMRASDMAGVLAEGEIGVLMHDTVAEQAKTIAKRLKRLADGAIDGAESVLIGVADRAPGQGTAEGIVRDARADAAVAVRSTNATSDREVPR
jgi:hypothetical protein